MPRQRWTATRVQIYEFDLWVGSDDPASVVAESVVYTVDTTPDPNWATVKVTVEQKPVPQFHVGLAGE